MILIRKRKVTLQSLIKIKLNPWRHMQLIRKGKKGQYNLWGNNGNYNYMIESLSAIESFVSWIFLERVPNGSGKCVLSKTRQVVSLQFAQYILVVSTHALFQLRLTSKITCNMVDSGHCTNTKYMCPQVIRNPWNTFQLGIV